MRFIVDECTGPGVSQWLTEQGHDVFSVYEQWKGAKDSAILQFAVEEERIVITNDKDFGGLVIRTKRPHCGAILLRLKSVLTKDKIATLKMLFHQYADQLAGNYLVVTYNRIRLVKS